MRKQYWYIVAESGELKRDTPLSRQVLDEWLVCFRDERGKPVILKDRCLHRSARLSKGTVKNGQITCPYHGWVYNGCGKVVCIPAEGGACQSKAQIKPFDVCEQDGYVYVRLEESQNTPYPMPNFQKKGWANVRLQNRFFNTVANCVENFIDIPHTVFVHEGIFREPSNAGIQAQIIREKGEVHVSYENESKNLGSFSWFLNPKGKKILHTDSFIKPNVTHVAYTLPSGWQYLITSQSVPVSDKETLVYTDITYNFGVWTPFAKWIVKRQAQKVIDQDIEILNQQMEVLEKYKDPFYNTKPDLIHKYVSEILDAIADGKDPNALPDKNKEVTFYV